MTWLQRYRIRQYVRDSIWVLPFLGMLAAIGAAQLFTRAEAAVGWQSSVGPDTAQAVLGTLASSMFTFIVFVSSALLVAVQLASSLLTPRIIGLVFRDRVTKLSLVVFVFAFSFTLSVLAQISPSSVPHLSAHVAAYSCAASLGVFLFLIDHVGKALRPSGALWMAASLGRKVIDGVYPDRLSEPHPEAPHADLLGETPTGTITNTQDGVVRAFDVRGLLALAERADCVLELVPQVGDFIAAGDPLFRIYRGKAGLPAQAFEHSVAVGPERTLEQDPAFVFRILVDIACKGLSPAINDPTTAVLAIDQIHHLLRMVGSRRLADGRVCDGAGRLRLLYRTPDWEDFVRLAVTEIRQFGGASIQVTRRLRAMLENLIQTLPEERAPLLRQELVLLHRSAERCFTEPEDRALADVSDLQGVGGKHHGGQVERRGHE